MTRFSHPAAAAFTFTFTFAIGAAFLLAPLQPSYGQGSPPAPAIATAPDDGKPVSFLRDVRPILSKNCFPCHGPDEKQRKADLRLDTEAGAFADLGGRKAFVRGASDESEAVFRVASDDPEERMPPGGDEKKLTPEQIDLLKRWIDQGAKWESHWAFVKPVRPPLPELKADHAGWVRNPIDRFVMARSQAEGLAPSPEADRHTLIRRICLDLTGLPPSPELLAATLKDQRPDWLEALADRLLRDPGYGERWARVWLDLARFADSKGYEKDLRRTIWRFRDWLIQALNADMPYDQFTAELLAGDLLPGATPNQILATAFHRNTLTNDEGGTDDEEFRIAAVKDRVDSTGQIWMGLSLGCAKCHSHKYDPITSADYYRFYAFFNQTEDADRFDDAPTSPFPTDEQQKRLSAIESEIKTLEQAMSASSPEIEAELKKWEAEKPWESQKKALPDPVKSALAAPVDKRTDAQKAAIRNEFAQSAPRFQTQRDRLTPLRGERDGILNSTRTPILRELPEGKKRVTKIHLRGNFLTPSDAVEPGPPSSFHPWPKDAPKDRLGAARWLMDAENPLTARVAVNRQWAQIFGRGLVETQEDFGSQGSPPSHPELLDWLAVEFRESGWSFKKLCRLIVTSATYRQSSKVAPELAKRDPANRLLARGARFRMEAEMMRDHVLAIAGLLSRKMYGPSVMPYQPEGIWKSTYSTDKWITSPGEDKHRRGLYTFIKRTSPYPAMITLDAPSREVCSIRRISTNTPLQALVTLNDAVYIEAAQALARKMAENGGKTPADRIAFAMERALLRPPQPREVAALVGLYERRLAHFRDDPTCAKALATDPLGPLPQGWDHAELAALTAVCNVILNLDEVLTKN